MTPHGQIFTSSLCIFGWVTLKLMNCCCLWRFLLFSMQIALSLGQCPCNLWGREMSMTTGHPLQLSLNLCYSYTKMHNFGTFYFIFACQATCSERKAFKANQSQDQCKTWYCNWVKKFLASWGNEIFNIKASRYKRVLISTQLIWSKVMNTPVLGGR